MKVKGVNLGNWLVLEKWMSPSLFEGTTAEDEYYLPTQLSREVYEARIKIHRSEYITERDFTRIKSMGMDAVRIPVPYFIFGDREPFIGCIEELDKACFRGYVGKHEGDRALSGSRPGEGKRDKTQYHGVCPGVLSESL